VETEKREIDRQAALAPYLERFEEGAPPLHPSIALDQWERCALDEALDANGNGKQYSSLLVEGVAFQTKYFSDLDELENEEYTSADSLEKTRECLIANAAIGMALMDEMQRIVDSMVLSGNMGEAKKLTGFRNKLSQIVHEIKDRVGPDGLDEAEALSKEMVAPLELNKPERVAPAASETDPDETSLAEPEEEPPKPIKLNRHANLRLGRPVEETPNHSKKLLLLFAVAIAAWMILIVPRFFRTTIPELTAPEIPAFEAVKLVEARPPSLYIVVNGQTWKGIPADRRLHWVEQVAETASTAGYTGIHVRTDKGASVAQWLKRKGARLVKISASGS
jgi:hypothetical protein